MGAYDFVCITLTDIERLVFVSLLPALSCVNLMQITARLSLYVTVFQLSFTQPVTRMSVASDFLTYMCPTIEPEIGINLYHA
jgi:hypothetical protein